MTVRLHDALDKLEADLLARLRLEGRYGRSARYLDLRDKAERAFARIDADRVLLLTAKNKST